MPERTRCGVPCLIHDHDCDRSPGHIATHRDVQQRGDHSCEWDTPSPQDAPALVVIARRLRAERDEARDRLREVADLRDKSVRQRDAAREQVKRVRDRHHPIAAHLGDPDDDDNLITACNECEVPYPCAIIRALDEAEADRG